MDPGEDENVMPEPESPIDYAIACRGQLRGPAKSRWARGEKPLAPAEIPAGSLWS